MNVNDKSIISKLTELVDQILSGYGVSKIYPQGISTSETPEINELTGKLVSLGEQYKDNYKFIMNLSKGKLDAETPSNNSFVSPYKQLHSELRYLTWQIQQIADGDYDQRVSFSGDFSEAINKMISVLRERETLANLNKENVRLFQSIFETSADGILICDMDNNVLEMSNAAREMLHVTEEDLQAPLKTIDFIAEEHKERVIPLFDALRKGIPFVSEEFKVKRKDGTVFWNEPNTNMVYDSEGEIKGYIVIFRDISKRKSYEQQLIKYANELKETNVTKDKLFNIIAHDLKNPFNALVGFSEVLLNEMQAGNYKEAEEYAGIINNSANHGYDLLVNLLDWSRLQSGRIVVLNEFLSLNELIRQNIDIASLGALAKQLKIQYDDLQDYLIYSDKAILNTILRNLLSNAIKYTAHNGEVEIKVKKVSEFFHVSVKDSGVGIAEKDIEKLFRVEVIQSTRGTDNEGGTGLGLILCKDFINKIGGEIWVESTYGNGTTFTFSIPGD